MNRTQLLAQLAQAYFSGDHETGLDLARQYSHEYADRPQFVAHYIGPATGWRDPVSHSARR